MRIRLNRYLSQCGAASRRKADELIKAGAVSVNGRMQSELGVTIDPEKDSVELSGRVIKPERKRYIILNKPKLYITAIGEGEDEKRTIQELINDIPERVYPVGRLDYDVEGLLILTNDGELANRIHHPSFELRKLYRAYVKGEITKEKLFKMSGGTDLEDGFAKPDSIEIIKSESESSVVEISFHEGRNHLVKRFFGGFGHNVQKLQRLSVGPINLGSLKRGEWRDIKVEELERLNKALRIKAQTF